MDQKYTENALSGFICVPFFFDVLEVLIVVFQGVLASLFSSVFDGP